MGTVDKGLQPLRGKPLVQWVIDRFRPQVDELLINANQNIDIYKGFGYPVVSDAIAGYAGPLAGFHRALDAARHPLVATAPCDSPFLPRDLVARLLAALEESDAEFAVAKTGLQPHPVFSLCRKSVLPTLTAFLDAGSRKIDLWYSRLRVVEVAFDDQAAAFSNINTREELSAFERGAVATSDKGNGNEG